MTFHSFLSYFALSLILLFGLVSIVESKPHGVNIADREWKVRKVSCEESECRHIVRDEAYNCINECISPSCYEKVYASSPLEDGEIDTRRNRDFIQCLRDESRSIKVSETVLL
jgi:hypothetical protein